MFLLRVSIDQTSNHRFDNSLVPYSNHTAIHSRDPIEFNEAGLVSSVFADHHSVLLDVVFVVIGHFVCAFGDAGKEHLRNFSAFATGTKTLEVIR